jgi:hypothetical protein
MRPRITALAVGVVAALALVVAPASAADGAVRITLDVNFVTGVEEFTATGAFCPAGEAESFDTWVTGRGAAVFHLTKVFTCSDGSGSLAIHLNAPFIGARGGTTGGWRVTGGNGDYASATGGGHIAGVGNPAGIVDTYTGVVRR